MPSAIVGSKEDIYPSKLPQPTKVPKSVRSSRLGTRTGKDESIQLSPGALREEATLHPQQNGEDEKALSNAGTPVRGMNDVGKVKRGVGRGESRKEPENNDKQWLEARSSDENKDIDFQKKLQEALSSASFADEKRKPAPKGGAGELVWDGSDETFKVANGSEVPRLDSRVVLPVLEDRLFFQAASAEPRQRRGTYYFCVDEDITYQPFCADFGPFNLGMTHQFCESLRAVLCDPLLKASKIVMLSGASEDDTTNAIYLLGAFLVLHLGATPEQAWHPFARIEHCPCIPYRDATWAQSCYDLHVTDCWAGLVRAKKLGLYEPLEFREKEYFYYDDPKNGDMHEVVKGKFIAFKGPTAKRYQVGHSLLPTDYTDVFRVKGVRTVVRLNDVRYDRMKLVQEGFHHYDLPFTDCSTPPDEIVDKFLRICEANEGVVAVHCLAGLGRTGTLIAMFMIKHMQFTAPEAIAWLRIVRPGSVIGPQQQYLSEMQPKLQRLGARGTAGFGLAEEASSSSSAPEDEEMRRAADKRRRESQDLRDSQAHALAEMVRKGMSKRDHLRRSMEDVSAGLHVPDTPVTPLTQPPVVSNGRRSGSVSASQEASGSGLAGAIRKRSLTSSASSSNGAPRRSADDRDLRAPMPAVRESGGSSGSSEGEGSEARREQVRGGSFKERGEKGAERVRKSDGTLVAARERLLAEVLQLKEQRRQEQQTGAAGAGAAGAGAGAAQQAAEASSGAERKEEGRGERKGVGSRQSWPAPGPRASSDRGPLKTQAYNSVFGNTAPVGGASAKRRGKVAQSSVL